MDKKVLLVIIITLVVVLAINFGISALLVLLASKIFGFEFSWLIVLFIFIALGFISSFFRGGKS